MKKIRVWDLPIRLFHWSLVLLIAAAVITEKIGGDTIVWHFRCGYAALTLVLFRIVWGLIGTAYARFSSFIYAPASIIEYAKNLKKDVREKYLGHNPLGSLSVFALLGIVLVQACSGLFANDDIAHEGVLAKFVSKGLSDKFTWFHAEVSANLVYLFISLHLVAVAYYHFRKKQNMIKPMITGDKFTDMDAPSANDSWTMRLLALAAFAACAGAVYYVVNL